MSEEAPMTDQPPKRRGNPAFVKGNPGGPGRKKKVYTAQELFEQRVKRDLKAAAKENSAEAYQFLLNTMRDETLGVKYRLSAATQILDRGWGKPTNQTDINVNLFDKMSDVELVKMITGNVIEGELVVEDIEAIEEDSN